MYDHHIKVWDKAAIKWFVRNRGRKARPDWFESWRVYIDMAWERDNEVFTGGVEDDSF